MKPIREKIETSDFGLKKSEIFLYQSLIKTNKVLFIIKGMYGRHSPDVITKDIPKWDVQLVNNFTKYAHIVCCNTSSGIIELQANFETRKEAYKDKTFQQEVGDIKKVVARVKDIFYEKGIPEPEFYFFGKSFGGTILLALQESLAAKAIYMVGSGCGKSETTTNSLLKTMPEESVLLKNISYYEKGKFYFFRGELDDVVPKESQEKIVSAIKKDILEYIVMDGVDHEFERLNGLDSDIPLKSIMNKISDSLA